MAAAIAFLVGAVLLSAASPSAIAVAEPPARVSRPWYLRADGEAAMGFKTPEASTLGLSVGRSWGEALAAETGFGVGRGVDERAPGWAVPLLLRWSAAPSHGPNALTFAFGPRFTGGESYGFVWLLHGELGWELRTGKGLVMLFAVGLERVMNDSTRGWFGTDTADAFTRGQWLVLARAGVGYAF